MFRSSARRKGGSNEQSGYMLLVLMLAVAMLAITLLGVATNYRQSIRRDREVEMIHRGVQYERAVRLYYRRNKNYPPSIDRLLESNNIRYLRQRYKDPMTRDGTWRIAHPTDVTLPGANTGLGTSGSPPTGGTGTAGIDTSGKKADTGGVTENPTGPSTTGPANTSGGTGEVLGGGPMIGVVSKSSQEGIHIFNEKSKYNEWLFIYLPTQEVAQPGHIPNGPFNPKAIVAGGAGGPGGLTTTPSTTTPDTTMPWPPPIPTAPTPNP